MSERSGILAGGNWVVDKLKLIDTYPQENALANILTESVGNGGGPFNLLIDLAALGATFPLAAIGLVGKDPDGEWVLQQCAKHGIDSAQLRVHEHAPTSYTDVMTVQSSGRRTFFHRRGANSFLGEEHFDFATVQAKIFYLGYVLLLDRLDQADTEFGTVAARMLHDARDAGFKTSIDLVSEDSNRFAEIVLPALPHVDYCILNEFEIERTTGIATRHDENIDLEAIKRASIKLLQAGVNEWVIVHFPEGVCALGNDGILRLQGSVCVPQSEIVSSVGAGDAFAAGVLYGLHEDRPIEIALRYGVTAAASCLRGAGTSDGIRQLDECVSLETKFGFRKLELL
jgi:sugar/nucleoside kinase (ribokinase family)